MPRDDSARISEFTFMLPSSVAIAVPERPATMIAVVSGASSRSTVATMMRPIISPGSCAAMICIWMIIVAPTKKAMTLTSGNASKPVKNLSNGEAAGDGTRRFARLERRRKSAEQRLG